MRQLEKLLRELLVVHEARSTNCSEHLVEDDPTNKNASTLGLATKTSAPVCGWLGRANEVGVLLEFPSSTVDLLSM